MTVEATTVVTPLGELALLLRDGVLVAAGFSSIDDQFSRLRTSERLRRHPRLEPFTTAVEAYFAGSLDALDVLPVDQPGGAFRQAAWKAMRAIPPGEVISYAELAARAGSPGAVRAAGSACAQNRVAPVVPCHRIVRSSGALGGYYYGLDLKTRLLAHEGAGTPGSGSELFLPWGVTGASSAR